MTANHRGRPGVTQPGHTTSHERDVRMPPQGRGSAEADPDAGRGSAEADPEAGRGSVTAVVRRGSCHDGAFCFDLPVSALGDERRLAALDDTGLVDVRDDVVVDRVTRLAQWVTGAPVALVTLVDAGRQVFVGAHGLEPDLDATRETPLSQSFCRYVVLNDAPLAVEDVRAHPVLSQHAGLQESGVIAYAGHPVRHPDGTPIGTVCVADPAPRAWHERDLAALAELAAILEADVAHRVRRRTAEKLRKELESVVHRAPGTGIVAVDAAGVITFANEPAGDLLGTVQDALDGQRLDDLVRHWRRLDGDGTPDGAEDWLVSQDVDGSRVVSVRRTEVRDEHDRLSGGLFVYEDVSDRRRAQELLRESVRKQQAAVQQLKSLDRDRDEFVAIASHELRTPVTSILGFVELLAEGSAGPLNPAQAKLLARVQRNSERLLRLVEDLLPLTRRRDEALEPVWTAVDVGSAARQAVDSVAPHLLGRLLDVVVDVESSPVIVRGDSVEIERILVNLVSNAVKYTPDGGRVEVVVRRAGASVEIVVSDTGVGIEHADQQRVFEPFYRSRHAEERDIQGTGLGLSLVARLVQAHGGTVSLDSEPGSGTSVAVRLPLRA